MRSALLVLIISVSLIAAPQQALAKGNAFGTFLKVVGAVAIVKTIAGSGQGYYDPYYGATGYDQYDYYGQGYGQPTYYAPQSYCPPPPPRVIYIRRSSPCPPPAYGYGNYGYRPSSRRCYTRPPCY